MTSHFPLRHMLLALAVVFVWGTNFVVIKIGLEELPPLLFAALRFTFVMLPAIFFIKKPEIGWGNLAAFGIFAGLQFGILFLAFVLLVVVTSFITVALVYFQLAREDHRWWWAAYVNGGMTGLFIYVYSFYYYFHRSEMYGMLQGSFYFGYMAVVSFAFFLMLGSAAFQSSLVFVKYIYSRIKSD